MTLSRVAAAGLTRLENGYILRSPQREDWLSRPVVLG